MNRVHKFWAWDILNKRMVKDFLFFRPCERNEHEAFHEFFEDWRDWEDGINRLCHVLQYTDVESKDGQPIFEGHIVHGEWPGMYEPDVLFGVVEWSRALGQWMVYDLIDGEPRALYDVHDELTIKGHVLTDPEMVEPYNKTLSDRI